MRRKSIRVIGNSGFLERILIKRIKDRMIHEITTNNDSTITIYFETKDSPQIELKEGTIIIRPWHENITNFGIKKCIELHLRDLLCVDSKGEWGPKDIFEWGLALESNKNLNIKKYPSRFWTSIKDVISLIETIIDLNEFPTLVTTVCSRKAWNSEDSFSEFRMLWRRFNNIKKIKLIF